MNVFKRFLPLAMLVFAGMLHVVNAAAQQAAASAPADASGFWGYAASHGPWAIMTFALAYFIWTQMSRITEAVTKNTEASSAVLGVIQRLQIEQGNCPVGVESCPLKKGTQT